MIGIVTSDQLDIDRSALGRMPVGRHRHENRSGRNQGIPLSDVRREPEDMSGAFLRHSRHDGDPVLVLRLHLKKDVFRMIREVVDVHALMVLRAEA